MFTRRNSQADDNERLAALQVRAEDLALYHYMACFFCVRVRQVIEQLGLDIELRDILRNPAFREELQANGGRKTVPCLRIEQGDGEVIWLYESRDIIHFLRTHFEQS